MTFTEALKILQNAPKTVDREFEVLLACGFTPLHLRTFLGAHLQSLVPERRVKISAGIFGDLAGTLESLADRPLQGAAIVIEWPDLDPRLGFRTTGSWGHAALCEILSNVQVMLRRMGAAIHEISSSVKVVVSAPTLPLPPLFHTPGWQSNGVELQLAEIIAQFCASIGNRDNVAIVNAQRLAEESPPGQRFDLKSDLLASLPYTLAHADAVAGSMARLVSPRIPNPA